MSLITLQPDMNIEPGHQWIILPNDWEGLALAKLLTGKFDVHLYLKMKGEPSLRVPRSEELELRIPHDREVDENIVKLIDQLAHVRFSAPGLVQMSMEVSMPTHDEQVDAMHEMDALQALAKTQESQG